MALLNTVIGRIRDPSRARAFRVALLCWVMLPFLTGRSLAQTREYELKAAFLFNFAQFVEWPTNAFATTNSPLIIGILGADPFGRSLEDLVRNESVRGHPLQVKHCRTMQDAASSRILFISRGEDPRLERELRVLGNAPVLTVSDIDDFAQRGGIICLRMAGNKVRFAINPDAAKKVGLQLSSKLLRLAEIAKTEERPR